MKFFNHKHLSNKTKMTENQLDHLFISHAMPILKSDSMQKTKNNYQHGETSVYIHSISVAYLSLKLANSFKLKYDIESIIRGALLHDFFLYDWHEKNKNHRLHGFRHPLTAYKNACKEYELNGIEKEIILRHMFPLTLLPPLHMESILVCLVDKYCGIAETLYCVSKKISYLDVKINCYINI